MRKELYKAICDMLSALYREADGSVCLVPAGMAVPEGAERVVKHIDLWNHNVEFIEQEEQWARPAVFVEFCPIQWKALMPGVEYRAEAEVRLHIVTDWAGSSAAGSELQAEALGVFDLPEAIHEALSGMSGETFWELDLAESETNHNHEEVVESVEVYRCVAVKQIK